MWVSALANREVWEPEPIPAPQKSADWVHCLPLWQVTHIFEQQHNASDNPGHHQHNSQDAEEACTRGEVHLAEREKGTPVR